MPNPVDLLYPRQRRRQLDREQSEVGRSTNKPSISRADSLLKMYELMQQGVPYAEAQREVHARFEIAGTQEQPASGVDRLYEIHRRVERGMSYADALKEVNQIDGTPGSVTRQIVRVRGIANNGGYPVELVPDKVEVTDVGGTEYAFIGVDEGIPGSDRTVYSVVSKGKIIDTFGITKEGDEFVIKDGDGNELGRCRSEEKFIQILHEASTGLLGEENPEDTSRFDIIDIE